MNDLINKNINNKNIDDKIIDDKNIDDNKNIKDNNIEDKNIDDVKNFNKNYKGDLRGFKTLKEAVNYPYTKEFSNLDKGCQEEYKNWLKTIKK